MEYIIHRTANEQASRATRARVSDQTRPDQPAGACTPAPVCCCRRRSPTLLLHLLASLLPPPPATPGRSPCLQPFGHSIIGAADLLQSMLPACLPRRWPVSQWGWSRQLVVPLTHPLSLSLCVCVCEWVVHLHSEAAAAVRV